MTVATDFTVNAAGDIRHSSGTATYTVLQLHRFLQDLADNPDVAGGADDVMDITSSTPSDRSTDNIITLLGTYNIDDDAAKYFYGGSIKQGSGATETLYSGLRVLGAVNRTTTQIQVLQDNAMYDGDTPFWGNQSTGGYNGNAAAGVLMRCLIKSREFGADIDGKRIIVTAREYKDAYDFFNVTLGQGEAVAALSTVADPQNTTDRSTVTAYTHITNTPGYQQIDIGDGNGNQPYYSKWTYGADTSGDQKRGMWEFIKDLVGQPSAKTIHGMDGELFFGVTHSFAFNTGVGTFTQDETVVWGTDITYDNLQGGTFSAGQYVRIGANGAAGRIVYDNGSTNMIVALEDPTITLIDNDVITEASAGTVTADCTATILNNSDNGGSGVLLGYTGAGATGSLYLQKITGLAPVNALPIRGLTSAATCAVNGAVTARTVPKVFMGSYVGSLIGAYGFGVDPDDLLSVDTVTDLDGDVNTPPNNVKFTVTGLASGEDYVLVGPKAGGNNFNFTQMTLATTLNTTNRTTVVVNAIPANTPVNGGTLRITLDDGRKRLQAYNSHNGTDTFNINSADYTDPNDATAGNGVMVSYLDKLAGVADEEVSTVATATATWWVRVRDGGGTPTKTFETAASFTLTGGGAAVVHTPDA